ncbi:DUF2271 domain-containing protein [Isoalcanivorax indicus]|uniref:DUF2271 domain-containing protein n=1 Tax=Isoalcanivorax indicus TaxID=2202653 RepID=UPI000DB8FA33|nr:DUF2271 domain-containing protein [Isoalcanivorax indicus]
MRFPILIGLSMLLPVSSLAAELTVSVEVPRLNVAEYHRPYVALWLEHADTGEITSLSVWYDLNLRNREGEKWLKDMRQWWRRDGRSLTFPVDSVSSATRPVGHHTLTFVPGESPLNALPDGDYRLLVEAAREVGGREVLTLPFTWPVSAAHTVEAQGEHELGAVSLTVAP